MRRTPFPPSAELPPVVLDLYPRERQLASLVYGLGAASANDVMERVSPPLSNAAVRSMLNRLVRKGILKCETNMESRAFVYSPGLSARASREQALRQFADDYFDGSLEKAAAAVFHALEEATDVPAARRPLRPGRGANPRHLERGNAGNGAPSTLLDRVARGQHR